MSDDVTIIPDNAKKLFRRLLDAREKYEELDTQTKKAKQERDDLTVEVHDALIEAVGKSTLPVDLGPPYGVVKLLPTETIYANVINADRLQDYLENSAQVDEYTRAELAKGRLNELARQLEEDNQPFPPGLDFRKVRGVRVTKQKG